MSLTATPSGGPLPSLPRTELEAKTTVASILALRRDLDAAGRLAEPLRRTIESIHKSLSTRTDQDGYHRVNWRSNGRGGQGQGAPVARGGAGGPPPASSTLSAKGPLAKGPPPKYVSHFKQSESTKDAVLLIIIDKLNKFAPINYVEIHDFLCQILDSGQTSFLKEFMKVVFQKATKEELFCPHYVRLLCELSAKYKTLLTEMVLRYKEYSHVFEDISEMTSDSYATLIESNSDKNYRRGYSQFLAELVKYNVLEVELFVETLQNIIGAIPVVARVESGKITLEEYIDCLLRILKAIQTEKSGLALSLRKILKERFVSVLEPMTVKDPLNVGLTPKGRFGIVDIVKMIKAL